jgi:HD-GYP domain-containing protein (c-di-GMP phosphodiesterase class II)
MLSDTDAEAIVHAVVYHHERYGGGGYPYGLSAEEIPMVAQIVTIADVFAALTTKRSYKPPMSSFKALAIMKDQMTDHFNPDLFKAFVHLMGSQSKSASSRV